MAKQTRKSTKTGNEQHLVISPPNFGVGAFEIEGTTPLVQNKFSAKAREEMMAKQAAGSKSKKGSKRKAKNFDECYEQALHVAEDGWYGIPAPAFRNAMVDACRACGFKMTHAKMAVFIDADGFDADEATPLVKITKGEPKRFDMAVRNESGVADIRPRPKWSPGWRAKVRIRFDADMFSMEDVANLLSRVGMQVGVGEGRPFSKKSCGQGWGKFRVLDGNE